MQHRIAFKPQGQLVFNTVDILVQKLDAIIPGRAIHHPVLVVDFIDAKQHALLVLTHIGKALKINDKRQFMIQRCHFRNGLGQQIVV